MGRDINDVAGTSALPRATCLLDCTDPCVGHGGAGRSPAARLAESRHFHATRYKGWIRRS